MSRVKRQPAPKAPAPNPTPDIVELTEEQAAQKLLSDGLRKREQACQQEVQKVLAKHRCATVIERREFSDGQPPQYLIHFTAQP